MSCKVWYGLVWHAFAPVYKSVGDPVPVGFSQSLVICLVILVGSLFSGFLSISLAGLLGLCSGLTFDQALSGWTLTCSTRPQCKYLKIVFPMIELQDRCQVGARLLPALFGCVAKRCLASGSPYLNLTGCDV